MTKASSLLEAQKTQWGIWGFALDVSLVAFSGVKPGPFHLPCHSSWKSLGCHSMVEQEISLLKTGKGDVSAGPSSAPLPCSCSGTAPAVNPVLGAELSSLPEVTLILGLLLPSRLLDLLFV